MGATHVRVGSAIFGARESTDSGWAAAPGCSARAAPPKSAGAGCSAAAAVARSWSSRGRRRGRRRSAAAAWPAASAARLVPRHFSRTAQAARCRRATSRSRRRPRRSGPLLMVAARQRSMTESIMLRSGEAPAAMRVLPPASLVGRSATRDFAEFHPRRQRNAGAEREHLAGAERRHEGQHGRAGVGDRRADQRLVAVVRQPHHEHGAALGDDVARVARGA